MSGFGSTQVEEDHHRSLPSKMNPPDSSSSTRIGAAVVLVGSYRDAVAIAMAARVPCALARVRCDEVGHRGGGTDDRASGPARERES